MAQSLQKRDGFDFEKSYYLWLEHVLPTILETRGATRVVVDFDLLMADPSGQLQRMAKALDVLSILAHPVFRSTSASSFNPTCDTARLTWRTCRKIGQRRLTFCEPTGCWFAQRRRDEVPADRIEEEFEAIDTRLNAMSPALEYMSRSDRRVVDLIDGG